MKLVLKRWKYMNGVSQLKLGRKRQFWTSGVFSGHFVSPQTLREKTVQSKTALMFYFA